MKRILATASVVTLAVLSTASYVHAQSNATPPDASRPSGTYSGTNAPSTQNPSAQSSGGTTSEGMSPGGMSSGGMSGSSRSGGSAAGGSHIDSQTARQVQSELKSEGLYNGPVDGKIGKQTRTAVMEYQRKQGLHPSGQLDQQTVSSLMSHSGSSSGGAMPSGSSSGMSSGSSGGSSGMQSR